MAKLCKRMGLTLGKEGVMDASAVMAEMDRDGDQEVTFEEFKAWWKENGNKNIILTLISSGGYCTLSLINNGQWSGGGLPIDRSPWNTDQVSMLD